MPTWLTKQLDKDGQVCTPGKRVHVLRFREIYALTSSLVKKQSQLCSDSCARVIEPSLLTRVITAWSMSLNYTEKVLTATEKHALTSNDGAPD